MAGFPPKKNTAFTFYTSLVSQTDTDIFQANPTLAAGDVKVSIDGGLFANIGTLPSAIASNTKVLTVSLTAAEMNGDVIIITFQDAAGAEWQDQTVTIYTDTETIGGIATILATAAVFPAGANEVKYTVTSITTGLPIEGVEVWITTDLAGLNVIWSGFTDAFGAARDVDDNLPWLDNGIYYFWRKKGGVSFTNPDTETIP